ncbi:MAG TPA: MATE family efflux transporter [Thermoanaerobaculia bacterium]
MRGSIFRRELRELFRLAAPLAAAQAGTQMMGLVDVAVLGRLGAHELAGAGMANAVYFAVSVFGMGMMLGIDPLVAQAVGAGDHTRARHVLWQGIWLSIGVTAVLTVVLLAGAAALPIVGAEPEVEAHARSFLLVRTASLLPFLMFFVIRAYLQAHHVTRPLIVAMVVANILNLLLDLAFVFGFGPIPALGVPGAALATVICTTVEVIIVAIAVRKMKMPAPVDPRPDRAAIAQAVRVGFPIALHMGAEIGVFALVALLAGRLGALHLAAHQLVIGLASFSFTTAVGVATAGSVRVGNAIGAHDSVRTRVAGHAAFVCGLVVMGVAAAAFALIPGPLARIFTNEAPVIAVAIPLMMVAAVFQLSDGIQAVGAGVLRGAADTKYTFYANMVGHWLIGLPIALWLGFSRGMGILGLWWGLCVGLTVVAVLLFVRFERLSRGAIAPIAH